MIDIINAGKARKLESHRKKAEENGNYSYPAFCLTCINIYSNIYRNKNREREKRIVHRTR
jgi:hypothetical protein